MANDALHNDLAAVKVDDRFYDSQSQPGTFCFGIAGRIDPVKAIKYFWQVFLRDPYPAITTDNLDPAIDTVDRKSNFSAGGRVTQGI